MKSKQLMTILILGLGLLLLLTTGQSANAAPPPQTDPAALVTQGDALLWENKFSEAEAAYDAAIAADPNYAPAYAHRCYLRTFQKDYEEALADCQQAVALAPNEAEGYIYLTRAYAWSGYYGPSDNEQDYYAAAIEAGKQAIALAPENGLAHSFLGEAYLNADQMEAGKIAVHRGTELAPDDPEVHHNLAYMYGEFDAIEAKATELELSLSLAPRFAKNYIRLGGVYWNLGRYNEALEMYRQALSIQQATGDRIGEGDSLYYIGYVHRKQRRYDKALEMYQQALIIRQEIGDRAGEGNILHNLGIMYADQDRNAEALDAFQQALAIRQEIGYRASAGFSLINIGMVYRGQGHSAKALESFQQALIIARELGNRGMEGQILQLIAGSQEGYVDSLESLQQALAIHRETGNRTWEGTALRNIGLEYRFQGHYAKALESFQQALVISREEGNRFQEGINVNNVGMVYYEQGRYVEALEMYRQALALHREVGNRNGEGFTLNNIGTVYHQQGRYTEALEMYQQALTIWREVGAPGSEAQTLNNIGGVYHDQGRYAEALEMYQQALAIRREIGDRAGEGQTLTNIGGLYRLQERYAEALESHQQALVIVREVGARDIEGTTLSNIGTVYQIQGHYVEALEAYQQSLNIREAIRATAGSEQGRAIFIAQSAPLYALIAILFHDQGQDEEAFFTSERGRARAFLDSLATGQVQLTDDEAADMLAQEQAAYAQRQAAQDALAKARTVNPPDPDLVTDLEMQLTETEAAHAEALATIEARGDQFADLVPGRSQNVLDVSGVQARLDPQTTLLSYFVLDDQVVEDKTLVFLITADNFEVVELDISGEELTNHVSRFRDVLSFREPDATRPVAQELYQLLLAPFANSLHTPHLAIVPHGPLHYLPFTALLNPETDRYLLQDYSLVTLPSASALPFIQDNAQEQEEDYASALIVGNPTSGDFDATASLAVEREGLGALPFAEQEAEAIAALYGVEPLIGEAATEGAVRERVADAGILHMAAHGAYNPVAPLSSLIALAPDDTYDGWLTVGEVYGLDLNQTDLVVLSACQTQLGELSAGDELVGLTRAFIFAGTPTVVATLWNVDDEATSQLMERFYTHLNEGLGKAEALRQAQLEFIEEGTYADPYYWSAFVMSGDGGEVSEILPGTADVADIEQATSVSEIEDPTESTNTTILWGWLIGGGGLLIIAIVGRMLWRQQAKRA